MSQLERGRLLIQQQRYDLAEQALRQAMTELPNDGMVHGMLALALCGQKQMKAARTAAKEAVALEPDLPFAHYVLGCVLHDSEAYAAARQSAREAIRLDPACADYFTLLGQAYMAEAKWAKGLKAVEKALALDPEDADAANFRALALTQLGRTDAARSAITRATSQAPEDPLAHANQGWAHLHANQPAKALPCFREALRLDPEHEFARHGMVTALKARHLIYRMMLGYFLWMSRISPKARIGVVIGVYILVRMLRATAMHASPAVAIVVWPVLIACVLFILLSWVADPVFNLMLRFNRYGRYALTHRQVMGSNWLVGLLVGAIVAGVGAYLFSMPALGALAVCMAVMILPVSATYETATQASFRQAAVVCIVLVVMAVLLTVGILLDQTAMAVLGGGVFALFMIGFLLAFSFGTARQG
ncbi:MAG: tetratricopeptide repeat protein [Phycisphaeraceae bacterium]